MKNLHKSKHIASGILLFFSFLIYSCQSEKTESGALEFEQRQIEKESCVGEECARVSLSYPFFKGDGESVSLLNVHVEQQLVLFLNMDENQEIVPLDSAVSGFLDSYQEFKNDFDSPQEWEITVDAKVALLGKKLISIVFDTFSFTGGAHPNTYRLYLNFDPVKNEPLKNQELVLDENGLLILAESKFRQYHDVIDSVTLAVDGRFFLEDEKNFFLPSAMGFEGEEFVLYYNPYEIGPYVMGSTELRFTKEEIKGLVKTPMS